ncbi:MAG: nucleotide exchange factor GrpE [Acidimicrobiia bacterium]
MDAEMIAAGDGDDTSAPGPTETDQAEEIGVDDVDEELERASEIEDITSPLDRPLDPDSADAAGAAVEDDLVALVSERDQFKDIALRLQADFDNYRKRVAAQQSEAVERGTGKVAEALLPVLDACEAAFLQHPGAIEPLFNLLLGELRKLGLESLDLQDRPFDPTVADAVLHEPGDGGEPVVSEVLRSGYLWKGRVLRPAMVKVRG